MSRDGAQPTLFDAFEQVVAANSVADESLGWERRYLSDLAEGPTVCCFPGWAGHYHERLVAQGLATREDAGFMDPGDPTGMMEHDKIITPKRATAIVKEYWQSPFPQFRYAITAAGLAILSAIYGQSCATPADEARVMKNLLGGQG